MGLAHPAEGAHRGPEIHVVASHQEPATATPELRDALAIGFSQAIADVNREQPDLVKITLPRQRRVDARHFGAKRITLRSCL
jgi:hypothetical protein